MQEFENLIKAKGEKISVISILINGYGLWKSILGKPVGRFSFLSNNVRNWKHYNLQSPEDERLKNTVPIDNQEQLQKKNEHYLLSSLLYS
jgi:hypothetical protein